ncbi:protease SohB [Isoalcanivorax beigongshangi]|uniref:Protease SohB n=1 Tax=Isoalcanivorax beigongshangi TaxID=3238810 RepID=A0ABV4AHV8_9GAMM
MIAYLIEYGVFLAKVVTLALAVLFVLGGLLSLLARQRDGGDGGGQLRVRHLNEELDELRDGIESVVLDDDERKRARKQQRKDDKARAKAEKKMRGPVEEKRRARVFVLDFDGDVSASEAHPISKEISALLQVADKQDEVVLRLESPGGLVHEYGFASSQLKRIRQQGLKLTICVDRVAASGGYMMACLGDRVLAAPFAVLGSIGVVAQIPNFHRLLKKNDVDVELMTAGDYKRTLTMLGENTDSDREKFQQELDQTHQLFKDFVRENRRGLDIDRVATGEHWYGIQARELGLVDEITTSDDYLLLRCRDAEVYELRWQSKPRLAERLGLAMEASLMRVSERLLHRGLQRWRH